MGIDTPTPRRSARHCTWESSEGCLEEVVSSEPRPGCKEVWGWGAPPAAAPWGPWIPWPGNPAVAERRPREAAPGGKGPGLGWKQPPEAARECFN